MIGYQQVSRYSQRGRWSLHPLPSAVWKCRSTRPGITALSDASITVAPASSTATPVPTCVIVSPSITTVASNSTSSSSFIVTTVPFLMMIRSLIPIPSLPRDALPGLRHGGRQVEPDRLRVQVRLERLFAELLPEPRMLPTAEWDRDVEHAVGVDPHRARIEPVRNAERLAHVGCPDPRGQPVVDPVREGEELLLVLPGDHGEHRSEDLLLRRLHIVAHALEHRRLEEEAPLQALDRR